MTAIPILSGIVADGNDFAQSFPVNMIPVPKTTGISNGFLRPAEGIVQLTTAFGANRGGTRWRNEHYRVMGSQFMRVAKDGTITVLGSVAGFNFCTFSESFDYLAVNGGGFIYLFNGTSFLQITDVDLGVSLDVEWINGYFISTDGTFIATSDITDPFSWNPIRYASSEASPDPINALQKVKNELYALNRYTVEVFSAVTNPGLQFPFARIEGAQIMKGCIGSRACCNFMQTLAFLGGGENESPAVWVATGGQAQKASTREIDDLLSKYTEVQLSDSVLESRVDRGHEFLYVHLPDQTLVFDGVGSLIVGNPVWFILKSGVNPAGGYKARGIVWCYDRWNVADSFGNRIGYLTKDVMTHYGEAVSWAFNTPVVYNEGLGAQLHELELVAISGNVAGPDDPLIAAEYTEDGRVWSQPKYIRAGRNGERLKRLSWTRQGSFSNWRAYRFSGDSKAPLAFARLEATIEGLQS